MNNNKNFDQSSQNPQTESQAAKLAVIATAVTTFGDALATLAAMLALEEERQEERQAQSDKDDYKNMQKQIHYLTTEVEKLKKQVNKERPYWI
ncbi:hypothetical protein [Domibacillus mangrovi]|uniref:Translation initiation factor 2 n=1 Tax=Domibacillus mangrovi TaxID=1714354 RepID=A0A1Q5P3R2_9BACI|nr:hypothetical protein [Domibacillus mangrovi]OKL36889.1 hypothetical protein BLL40_09225 [Domibacillus mangrovi]